MATITGNRSNHNPPFCDGISRRSFLHIGGLAMGGLCLPQILQAEARAGVRSSRKAVIMVFLSGGPPHQDMFDLKPDAPVEIRGEFQPIATRVPGIEICEHLPQLAGMMDRLAVIRSVVGSEGRHAAFQCLTGQKASAQPQGGWPALGSVVSKLSGASVAGIPAFMSLVPKMKAAPWSDPGQPGFLGAAYAPFRPIDEGQGDMVLNGITLDRLHGRQTLLTSFDRFRRDADTSGFMAGLDAFSQQAFGILTSNKLAEALDLEREDRAVRERYGYGSPEPAGYGDAGPIMNEYFLTARRLVEAGVRCVTVAYGRWDWHGQPHGTTFDNARHHLPILDQGLTALLEDLRQRGLERDVSVVVWGEFGRTPRINANGGRDHWPAVSCALLAGGGMRTGQVIGSTNRLGEHAKDRPVRFSEVFSTLYRNLGLDVGSITLRDLSGRPQFLVDRAPPIPELIG
ncbi:MAG TPA: DUF1501 domain-containing protein [Pirellulales bacterium]|jgi:hypothetical protein|nr:DUF1501 domain-containing protein [Pirellulales bacterium]